MESLRDENISARDDPELDALIELASEFGRVKLSLNSLMLRPVWRDKMRDELLQAGLSDDGAQLDEQSNQWLPIFYRLARKLQTHPTGMNMRMVAESMGVPVSSATRFIETMVQRQLLERLPDAHDRRLVLVQMTPTGERILTAMDDSLRNHLQGMLNHFSTEERGQLISLGSRLFQLWHASLERVPVPQNPKHKETF